MSEWFYGHWILWVLQESRSTQYCTDERDWTREGVRRGARGLHSEYSQPVVVSIVWWKDEPAGHVKIISRVGQLSESIALPHMATV